MKYRIFCVLLVIFLFVGITTAAPTTGAASAIGNNNFTLTGTGVTGTGWFQWGFKAGSSWSHTKNITAVGGTITYTMVGSPIFGNTTYYFRACDSTGCGSELNLFTLPVTPLPQTTYGQWATNITENGLDPGNLIWNSMQPYMQFTGPTIFYMLIFSLIFVGLFLRVHGTQIATSLGVICLGLFGSSTVALQLGLPPEVNALAMAFMYISLAGAVTSFTFK